MPGLKPEEANPASIQMKPKARNKKTPLETVQAEAEKLMAEIADMENTLSLKRRDLHKCREAEKILEAN